MRIWLASAAAGTAAASIAAGAVTVSGPTPFADCRDDPRTVVPNAEVEPSLAGRPTAAGTRLRRVPAGPVSRRRRPGHRRRDLEQRQNRPGAGASWSRVLRDRREDAVPRHRSVGVRRPRRPCVRSRQLVGHDVDRRWRALGSAGRAHGGDGKNAAGQGIADGRPRSRRRGLCGLGALRDPRPRPACPRATRCSRRRPTAAAPGRHRK